MLSTYTVNTTADLTGNVAGLFSLRQAVAAANAHAGADAVVFATNVFPATGSHTITLTQGPIKFTDASGATTVTGPGAAALTVSGNNAGRVFTTGSNTTVTLAGLTITGGLYTMPDAAGNAYGGGIYSAGSLTLSGTAVTGNTARLDFGAPPMGPNPPRGNVYGGGVYATGPLTIVNSTLSGNSAQQDQPSYNTGPTEGGSAYGGGVYATATVTVTGSTVAENSAAAATGTPGGAAGGGGIYAVGALSVASSTVMNNSTIGGDGSYRVGAGNAVGGGLYGASTVTVTGSTISGNGATAGDATNEYTASGTAEGGGIYAGGGAIVTGSTLSNNGVGGGTQSQASSFPTPPWAGGGLYAATNATLSNDTITGNSAGGGTGGQTTATATGAATVGGGGAFVGGTLAMSGTTVSANRVSVTGAVYDSVGGTGAGGGVAVIGASTITGSTIDHNTVTGGAGADYTDFEPTGGGGAMGGGLYALGAVTATNSTIVDNTVTGGAGGTTAYVENKIISGTIGGWGSGGGIDGAATVTLVDSTVSGNFAIAGAGGALLDAPPGTPQGFAGYGIGGGVFAGGTTLTNSVVWADSAGGVTDDVDGGINANSTHSAIGVGAGLTNGVNGNQVGVGNAMLSALGSFGGPTQTEVPLPGSPLINAGTNALLPAGVTTDQRGSARVVGGTVDVGAVEATGAITGGVFNDANADGKEQSTEAGIAGFTVFADLNRDGTFDAGDVSAVTAANGLYALVGVPTGTYPIGIAFTSGYRATTAISASVTVPTTGATVVGPTFGQTRAAQISGSAFTDANGNGKKDAGETAAVGVRVYIDANTDGKYESTETSVLTDESGNWAFNTVAPGTYAVRLATVKATTPVGGFFTFSVGYGSIRSGYVFGVLPTGA